MSAADVVALLLAVGFTETGVIANPGVVGFVGGRAVGGRFSYRRKFRRGDVGCTVGQRTTCLYRIGPNGPSQFQNLRTADVQAVRDALTSHGATA